MFLNTKEVALRPVEREDLPQLRDWRNDLINRKRFREFRPLNMKNQEKWFVSLSDGKNIMFIITTDKDVPIGVCGLTYINWKNRSAEISLFIGRNECKTVSNYRHVIYLLCSYCFDELGLHRFWGEGYIIDNEWIELFKSLGFKVDGTIPDTYWWDGKWHPSAFISILENEWRDMKELYLD